MPLSGWLQWSDISIQADRAKRTSTKDQMPLGAASPHVSKGDIIAVASELMSDGHLPIEGADARSAISGMRRTSPSSKDIERVKQWPIAAGQQVPDAMDFSR